MATCQLVGPSPHWALTLPTNKIIKKIVEINIHVFIIIIILIIILHGATAHGLPIECWPHVQFSAGRGK